MARLPLADIRLYAMNTNNGIQAFTVVPEPAAAVLGALGLGVLLRRCRHYYRD